MDLNRKHVKYNAIFKGYIQAAVITHITRVHREHFMTSSFSTDALSVAVFVELRWLGRW